MFNIIIKLIKRCDKMNLTKYQNIAQKYRKLVSRILFLCLVFVFLFTSYSWPKNSFFDLSLDIIGFVLIVFCSLGRIWSALYIYGYKNKKLIRSGPYSMVRNPLYFFSFLGALGIGLVSKNLIVFLTLILFFIIYYPLVVLAEENKLKNIHQEKYLKYMANTPRFLPNLANFQEKEQFTVNARKFRNVLKDVMWFFWFYILIKLVETLHHLEIIPVLWEIP